MPGPGQAVLGDVGADREDAPDKGFITRRRGLRLCYVPQEPHLPPDATVEDSLRGALSDHAAFSRRLDDIAAALESGADHEALLEEQAAIHEQIEALGGWDPAHELRGIAAALRLPRSEARVGDLSIGERRRVAATPVCGEQLGDRRAVDVAHHDVEGVLGATELVDGDDVAVAEGDRGLGLGGEHLDEARLGGELNPPDREWQLGSERICDGVDPEGNVFQVRAETP